MKENKRTFVDRLKRALDRPLPGESAQWKMAVHPKQDRRPKEEAFAYAGVLALLFPQSGVYELIFIKRRGDLKNDRHSGQISFPGGQYEAGDGHTRHTALRETEEEIGLSTDRIELLGSLSPLYIPVSGYMVHPYVGFHHGEPEFSPEVSEVQRVLTAPLARFLPSEAMDKKKIDLDGGYSLDNVPYFDLHGEVLWGATAMMLSELLELIRREDDLYKDLIAKDVSRQ